MNEFTKRIIENAITLLTLMLLLIVLTDASSQTLSIVGGYFACKIIADILIERFQDKKSNTDKERRTIRKIHESNSPANKEIKSSLQGEVIKVCVEPYSNVKKADVLLIVDSCKMEMEILAPADGLIQEVLVAEGDTLVGGEVLVRFY